MDRIIRLEVRNFLGVKAITLTPDGDGLLKIYGNNKQGKSSFIKGMEFLLRGNKALPDDAVRHGENHSYVSAKTDSGLLFERETTKSGWALRITRDGKKVREKPQALLSSMYKHLCIDPQAFGNMTPAEQVKLFMSLTGLDFTEIDKERDETFDTRTEVNRRVRDLNAKTADCYPGVPDEVVPVAVLATELNDANLSNQDVDACESTIRVQTKSNADFKERIAKDQETLKEREAHTAKVAERLKSLPVRIDTADLRKRIEGAEEANDKVRHNIAQAEISSDLRKAENESKELTTKLDRFAEQKREMIAAAECPVPGLTLGDDAVYLDGDLLANCSSAQQIRVGFDIAVAGNPELRLAVIYQGGLLDDAHLKQLDELAEQYEMLVLVECVGQGDGCHVVIEDGSVKEPATLEALPEHMTTERNQ